LDEDLRGGGSMNKMRRVIYTSIAFLMIFTAMISCGPANTTPGTSANDIDAFRSVLEKHHLSTKFAPFVRVDLIELHEVGKLGNAAGNNAGALYRGMFGAIPDSIPITSASQITDAQAKIDNWLYKSPGMIQGWQINPDEAVVIITRTPPKCAYFSYVGFIFNKYYEKEKAWKWVWTSYNDTLNNMTIKTSGTPDGAPGDPFDKDTVIIITADKGTEQRIRSALAEAGYPNSIINTYVIPSSMVKLGIGPEYDSIVFGQRITLVADEQAGEKYVNTITPAIKVTPQKQAKPDPLPAPVLRVRGTGKTEIDYQPALDDLRKAILAKYSNLAADELITSVWLPESYDAVQTETYVAGESRDTVYLRSEAFTLGNDQDEFVIVYGVNHAASGKATYSNCTFYGDKGWNGVTGIFSTEFEGTAEQYLPGNPLAKYLYVCKFARNCSSEKACIPVPTGPKAHGVALDEPAFIGVRAYMEPATMVGPIFTELLYDKAIKFSAR
ncbi:MAG: hypothetical protein JXA01_08805, partial [Dehalococcoidia bacterium]|nr:hypothetical protein [Dehalococcoidia bacterium]